MLESQRVIQISLSLNLIAYSLQEACALSATVIGAKMVELIRHNRVTSITPDRIGIVHHDIDHEGH